MSKITIAKQDAESLMIVTSGISAMKLSLAQIMIIENSIEVIKTVLGDYFAKREVLLEKGEKFLDAYNQKLSALYKKYGEQSNDPALKAFGEEGKKQLDTEVNGPIRDLGKEIVVIDLPDNLLEPLKQVFAQGAFFGQKGYNDSPEGRSSFKRTVEALGIKPEELAQEIVPAEGKIEDKRV